MIINFKSENIKNIRVVEISPKDNTVIISGKNGAGKSSVLDSIEYAFSGKSLPRKPIRDGELKVQIVIDLGEFKLTRTFTQKGSTLKIENNDKSIKDLLNETVARLGENMSIKRFVRFRLGE